MDLYLKLDDETKKEDERVRGICSCGRFRKLTERLGEIILCGSANGKNAPPSYEFREILDKEVCIATAFCQVGNGYNSTVKAEKMKECPYRR
jgi:hypothetical protein